VLQYITMIAMILVTPKAAAKHELLFNKLSSNSHCNSEAGLLIEISCSVAA